MGELFPGFGGICIVSVQLFLELAQFLKGAKVLQDGMARTDVKIVKVQENA